VPLHSQCACGSPWMLHALGWLHGAHGTHGLACTRTWCRPPAERPLLAPRPRPLAPAGLLRPLPPACLPLESALRPRPARPPCSPLPPPSPPGPASPRPRPPLRSRGGTPSLGRPAGAHDVATASIMMAAVCVQQVDAATCFLHFFSPHTHWTLGPRASVHRQGTSERGTTQPRTL
jgi:hypothetical protein